jgi:arsenate reductase-like glutaredoxin family protein
MSALFVSRSCKASRKARETLQEQEIWKNQTRVALIGF